MGKYRTLSTETILMSALNKSHSPFMKKLILASTALLKPMKARITKFLAINILFNRLPTNNISIVIDCCSIQMTKRQVAAMS